MLGGSVRGRRTVIAVEAATTLRTNFASFLVGFVQDLLLK